MFSIVAFYALYGCSLPFGKYLLKFSPPMLVVGLRTTLGGVILYACKFLFTGKKFSIKKEHRWMLFGTTFFGVYLMSVLRYWSLQHMPAAKLAFMLNCSPFIAALFSYLWFDEKLSLKKWIGLSIGLVGMLPLVIFKSGQEAGFGEFLYISWPEAVLFVSLMCQIYGMVHAKQLIKHEGYSATFVNCARMLGAGFLALISSCVFEGFFPVTQPLHFSLVLLCFVLVSNVICKTFYLHLVKIYSLTFISFSEFLSPFIVMFYTWMFLGETMAWHYLASGMIVLIGLIMFHQEELRQSVLQKTVEST